MSVSSLCCDVCFELLNSGRRRPMVICPNGHSVCSPCAQNMKLCPQCRSQCLPTPIANISLLKLLDGLVCLKVLVLGEAGVGKSAVMLRFTEERFVRDLLPTVGLDFRVKVLEMLGYSVKLSIWDTAGQERFRNITSSYYRGAHGVVFVYDITNRRTFERLGEWLREEERHLQGREDGDTIKLVLGNKADREGSRKVGEREAKMWAEERGMLWAEVSAAEDEEEGVREAFKALVNSILQVPKLWQNKVGGTRDRLGGSQETLANLHKSIKREGSKQKSDCCA